MANPMSTLGIIHTAISVIPVVAGLYSFSKYGAIVPKSDAGRIYLVTIALSVVTSSDFRARAASMPAMRSAS